MFKFIFGIAIGIFLGYKANVTVRSLESWMNYELQKVSRKVVQNVGKGVTHSMDKTVDEIGENTKGFNLIANIDTSKVIDLADWRK